jgi:hypothetical protein
MGGKMDKFIRCMKDDGQIVGGSFEAEPVDLPHTTIFWVRVPNDSAVYNAFPEPYSTEDQIYFSLTSPLTAEELVAKNLVKDVSQGTWNHTLTEEQAKAKYREEQIKLIDQESFSLIKTWCATQPEGCEEAFLALGIADKDDERYLDYVAKKNEIRVQQSEKKANL